MMYANEEKEPWNMNQAFFMRLDRRLDERDKWRIEGNLLGWFRSLRSIWANIHFKVKEVGHEKLEAETIKKFDEAKRLLSEKVGNSKLNQQLKGFNLSKVEIVLDELDILLNDLLYEYDFILPKKLKETWQEKVKGEY